MSRLLEFLYKYRAFFIFLLLQVVCTWMIVVNNNYQRTVYFNTTSKFAGSIVEKTDNISDFFALKKVNEGLAAENARLRELLLNSNPEQLDSLDAFQIPSDSLDSIQYIVRPAEVIDNSIRFTNNFITLDKGSNDGLRAGMGVISQNGVNGVVGKIRSVSNNSAHVISVLNVNNPISSKLKRTNRLGSVQWDGSGPRVAQLLYIPKDVDVQVGDTVVTSSFNAIFPKDIIIGFVKSAKPDVHQRGLEIEIELSVNFATLSYVYVIENQLKPEIDSLKVENPLDFNE